MCPPAVVYTHRARSDTHLYSQWPPGQFQPFPSLPKDTTVAIFAYLTVKDLCNLRKVSRTMERYMAQLPLRLRLPRHLNAYQTHICLLMFPSSRIISFELLPKMNLEAWKFMFSVLSNPVFDLKNITYDVLLDKAGRDLYSLGHFQQALQCFMRALEVSPTDEILIHNRGVCLLELQQFNEALACFEQSLKASPADNRTKSRHAMCLAKLGRHDEAMAEFDAVLSAQPDALTFSRRADLFAKLGKDKQALEDYSKCADELKDAAVYRARAELLRKNGDAAAADHQLQLAANIEKEKEPKTA